MALNKATLSTAILNAINAAFDAAKIPENDGPTIRQNFANSISDAMDAYVKTATITFAPGEIAVAGTATNQANPAPIVKNGGIS